MVKLWIFCFWILVAITADAFGQVAAPDPIVTANKGLSFEKYFSGNLEILYPPGRIDLAKTAWSQIASFRDALLQKAKRESWVRILSTAGIEEKLAAPLEGLIDFNQGPSFEACYRQTLKAHSPERLAVMFEFRQVYVSDIPSARARIKAGGVIPGLTMDEKNRSLPFAFTWAFTWNQPSPLALAVIIPGGDASPKPAIAKYLSMVRPRFEAVFEAANAVEGYAIVDSIVSGKLPQLAQTPAWFSIAVRNGFDVTLLLAIADRPTVATCLELAIGAPVKPAHPVSLTDWKPDKCDQAANAYYRGVATDVFSEVIRHGRSPTWLQGSLHEISLLTARANGRQLTLEEISRVVRAASGVDLAQVLQTTEEANGIPTASVSR